MDLPMIVLLKQIGFLRVFTTAKQSREQITDRILGAIENPHVDCIAHPTGRLLNRRHPYEVDMEAVMDAVQANRKLWS